MQNKSFQAYYKASKHSLIDARGLIPVGRKLRCLVKFKASLRLQIQVSERLVHQGHKTSHKKTLTNSQTQSI